MYMILAINQRNLFASLLLFFSMPVCVLATTWQGPYMGVYSGGSSGNNHVSTNTGSVTNTSYFTTSADMDSVNDAGTWTKNPDTMIAGIQAGYDWVWKQMVYGVAFDYSTLPLSSSRTINNYYPGNSDQYSIDTSLRTNSLFTLRGRLGYHTTLHFPCLFYFTGGAVLTQVKVNNSFNDNSAFAGAGSSSASRNQLGWTAGAGFEVASFNNVSVNFEYLYVRVPSVRTTGSISNAEGGFGIPTQSMNSSLSTVANFHANLFKIGLNYFFD